MKKHRTYTGLLVKAHDGYVVINGAGEILAGPHDDMHMVIRWADDQGVTVDMRVEDARISDLD